MINTNYSVMPDSSPGETHHIHIVNAIRQMIRDGLLKEGDPLPSERELAERFNVSRVPVREAVKILEFIGVLRRVRAKGLFVNHIDVSQTLNQFQFLFANTPSSLDELFEVRQALEIQTAQAAALRRTEQDLEKIEEQWVMSEHFISMGRDATKPTTQFHFAIARASHNNMLIKIYDFLLELHIFTAMTNLNISDRLMEAHSEHRKIFESIRDKNPEAAGKFMAEHMEHSRVLARKLSQQNLMKTGQVFHA